MTDKPLPKDDPEADAAFKRTLENMLKAPHKPHKPKLPKGDQHVRKHRDRSEG